MTHPNSDKAVKSRGPAHPASSANQDPSPRVAATNPFIEAEDDEVLVLVATETAARIAEVGPSSPPARQVPGTTQGPVAAKEEDGDSYYAHAFADDEALDEDPMLWNWTDAEPGHSTNATGATPIPQLQPAAELQSVAAARLPVAQVAIPTEPAEPAPLTFSTPPLTFDRPGPTGPQPFLESPTDDEFGDSEEFSGVVIQEEADADGDSSAAPYEEVVEDEQAAEPVGAGAGGGGGWTIPFLCAGIGLIACCLIIPLADANRRLAYEREQVRGDLDHLRQQVLVNDEFIRRVNEDPTLAERLAQRQMKQIRAGTKVLDLPDATGRDISPFQITAVPLPPPPAEYKPLGGWLANLCYQPRSRLYVMGAGLMLMAVGLVLGYARA